MNGEDSHFHFRTRITRDGVIVVPAALAPGYGAGRTVDVRLSPAAPGSLNIPVDDREVAEIAALQAEPAAIIRKCLAAQGAFVVKGTLKRRPPAGGR